MEGFVYDASANPRSIASSDWTEYQSCPQGVERGAPVADSVWRVSFEV